MEFKLETTRLILRPPKMSDYKDIASGISNINISKYLSVVPHPYTDEDAKWYISKCIKDWSKDPLTKYALFIELKETGRVIGALDLTKVDIRQGTAHTGSWLNEDYHRNAYMTEAKIAVNNFAFNKLGLRKLETEVYDDNIASNRTQQKLGYTNEGLSREHSVCVATGVIHSTIQYGMLKSEWESILPSLERELADKLSSIKK